MAETFSLVVRWSARISGSLIIGFVIYMIVGHRGLPNVLRQPVPVQLEFLGMFLSLAGFLLGWRWEGWGGIVALTGFALFCATEMVVNHRFPGGAIPLFAVPAILFLVSAAIAAGGSRYLTQSNDGNGQTAAPR